MNLKFSNLIFLLIKLKLESLRRFQFSKTRLRPSADDISRLYFIITQESSVSLLERPMLRVTQQHQQLFFVLHTSYFLLGKLGNFLYLVSFLVEEVW